MLKQITFAAAVAALFVAGNAGMASAESNVGVGAPGSNTSAGLQADWATTYGNAEASARPAAATRAYGYSREKASGQKLRRDKAMPKKNN
jgi:hypothetical protein